MFGLPHGDLVDDPGDGLSVAVVETLRSAALVRAAADAVELQAVATLVLVRRAQARAEALRRAEVTRRERPGSPRRPVRVDLEVVDRCTAQEVSVALWVSPVAARARVQLAVELVTERPVTFEALRTGSIDLVRARRVLDAVRPLTGVPAGLGGSPAPDDDPCRAAGRREPSDGPAPEAADVASLVEAEALYPGSVPALADLRPGRGAADSTPAQLTARLSRLVLRAAPDGASERTAQADARRACTVRLLPDGMALLSVTGRAELLGAAFARIDATARHRLRQPGGSAGGPAAGAPVHGHDAARSLDQTRVDVLLDALLHDGPAEPGRGGPPESSDPGAPAEPAGVMRPGGLTRAGGVHVTLALVAPAATVLAGGDAPGELLGLGPVPAPLVRALAADAAWQRWTSHPSTGTVTATSTRTYRPSAAVADLVRARDTRCRFPTCRRRARACDIDHVVRFPDGRTEPDNLLCLCRTHHLAKHRGRFGLTLAPDGTATWTAPTGHTTTDPPATWGAPPGIPDAASRGAQGTRRGDDHDVDSDGGAAAAPQLPEEPPF